MSARRSITLQDDEGNAQTGLTVQLWDSPTGSKLADFTEIGSGMYYVDYGASGIFSVKVGGSFPTYLDGIWISFDDDIFASFLASTANGEGASLVGIEDASARFTSTEMEGALGEMPTSAELASVANAKGASLVGVEDSGGYYAANNVEAALAELGAIFSLLDGLTADKDDLNVLAGTTITKAEIDALHNHDRIFDQSIFRLGSAVSGKGAKDLIGFKDSGWSTPLIVRGCEDDNSNINTGIQLDVSEAGGTAGKLTVKNNEGEYDVISDWEMGDLDLSTSNFLNAVDPADEGFVTNCLRVVDTKLWTLFREMEIMTTQYDQSYLGIVTSAIGDVTGDCSSPSDWYRDDNTYAVFFRYPLNITGSQITKIKLFFKAVLANAGIGYVKMTVGSNSAEKVVSNAVTPVWYELFLTIDASYSDPQELTLSMKGGGGTVAIIVSENIIIEVEH